MANAQLASRTSARSYETLDRPIEQFLSSLPQPKDVLKRSSGMIYGEQTKYVSWTVPATYETVELVHITDVQFGHIACKYDRVLEYRDWILSAPNRFMLWGGDLVDAWAMWSPGRGFEQIGDPQSQVFKFCEVWAPARHRVLGYVGGNHERRGIPGFGDLGILLAALLQVPYSNGKQLIDVHFGQHKPFKITLWHGTGSAQTKGGIAQKLDRFSAGGDSQLYLMGHLHQPMILPLWKERRATGQKLSVQKCIAAIGSSFLETWGTYGEVKGFSSHDVLMPRAILTADGKWELTLK